MFALKLHAKRECYRFPRILHKWLSKNPWCPPFTWSSNIPVLRQSLEMEKLSLDEAKEKEKVKKDEREREMRRVLIEAQFKDEMLTKEYQRKKDQMDSLQAQIEVNCKDLNLNQDLLVPIIQYTDITHSLSV